MPNKKQNFLLLRLCALLALIGLSQSPLHAAPTDNVRLDSVSKLAGWWIAIGDFWPKIQKEINGLDVEELLIVAPDGTVENRAITFTNTDAEFCAETGLYCSDAPLMARARVMLSGNRFKIVDRVDGDAPLSGGPEPDETNSLIRRFGINGRASWIYTLSPDNRVLTLQADGEDITRILVRTEPDRLRRLYAGFRFADLVAREHWRCYLSNATADDPAFEMIHSEQQAVPKFLDGFLKTASYAMTLRDAVSRPVQGDPVHEEMPTDAPVEYLMVESFSDIKPPTNAAEKGALSKRLEALQARITRKGPMEDLTLPLTDTDLDDFTQAISNGEETKRLFCLE